MFFNHSALQENSAKVSSLQAVLYSLDKKLDSHFNDLVNQIILLLPDREVDERELTRKNKVLLAGYEHKELDDTCSNCGVLVIGLRSVLHLEVRDMVTQLLSKRGKRRHGLSV